MQIANIRREKTLLTYSKETEFVGDQLLKDQLMEISQEKKRNIDNLDKEAERWRSGRVAV